MSPSGWNSPVSAFITINHSGLGSLVLCAVTVTPAKMTVKMRTSKPPIRGLRARVIQWAYEQGSRPALPLVGAFWLTFGRLAVRAEDGRLRAFFFTLAARVLIHG